jgi:hypothetical protein
MPTPSTSDLPKPKSWDEFEDIVWEIYTRRWPDSHAQRYGRSGQAQNGIDIYGQENHSGNYIAVQCKRYEDKKLNSQTIQAEITKAEGFSSPISKYLIATTTSRDTKIQDFIRLLNKKRKLENKFTVHVSFWEDICSYLAEQTNYDLLKKYYSEWGRIFTDHLKTEEKQAASIQYLLSLEIQQDCNLLQELLEQSDQSYLSEKWQSCLSQNRSVWQDPSLRLSLAQTSKKLMQHIQDFYQQLDKVEEGCKSLLVLKSQALPLESKQKYGGGIRGFGTMQPPALASNYPNESAVIALINKKKRHSMEFRKLKEVIRKAIDSGNRIINELNQQQG